MKRWQVELLVRPNKGNSKQKQVQRKCNVNAVDEETARRVAINMAYTNGCLVSRVLSIRPVRSA